jgi:hypothetical protein
MSLQGTTEHKAPLVCVYCGAQQTASTGVGSTEGPKDGDLTICMDCCHLQVFCEGVTKLRNLTDDEVVEAAGRPEIRMAVEAVAAAKRASKTSLPFNPLEDCMHCLIWEAITARAEAAAPFSPPDDALAITKALAQMLVHFRNDDMTEDRMVKIGTEALERQIRRQWARHAALSGQKGSTGAVKH